MPIITNPSETQNIHKLREALETADCFKKSPIKILTTFFFILLELSTLLFFIPNLKNGPLAFFYILCLSFLSIHVIFFSHALGHNAIFKNPKTNAFWGVLLANSLVGIDFTWWKHHHNKHHKHTNVIGKDPDATNALLILSKSDYKNSTLILKILSHVQHIYYPFSFSLSKIIMQILSIKDALKGRRTTGLIGLIAHIFFIYFLVFSVFDIFHGTLILISHYLITGFYLGFVFSLNHVGLPRYTLEQSKKFDFLTLQLNTTRDISNHRIYDFLFGGLNFQTLHHLFPNLPFYNLRYANRILGKSLENMKIYRTPKNTFTAFAEITKFLKVTRENI